MTHVLSPELIRHTERKRAYLVSGGEDPGPEFLKKALSIFPEAYVMAADRGAVYCLRADRLPDKVLGDMDSLPKAVREQLDACKVPGELFPSEKDDTDTALALSELLDMGFQDLILLAAVGNRWDHSLANILLSVWSRTEEADLIFWDAFNRMRLVGPGRWALSPLPGYYLSLIPLSPGGMELSLEGFKYDLKRYRVAFGHSRLISNEWKKEQGIITIHQGKGLLCLSRDKE